MIDLAKMVLKILIFVLLIQALKATKFFKNYRSNQEHVDDFFTNTEIILNRNQFSQPSQRNERLLGKGERLVYFKECKIILIMITDQSQV